MRIEDLSLLVVVTGKQLLALAVFGIAKWCHVPTSYFSFDDCELDVKNVHHRLMMINVFK